MAVHETQNRRRAGASALIVLDVLLLLMILAATVYTIVVSRMRDLGPATQYQQQFWQARARELCTPPSEIPLLQPLEANADPLQQLAFLPRLTAFSQRVWQLHRDCQEPRTVVISEDLLHFKVDQHDQFEGDPKPTFDKIFKYVEENLQSHNQIYILGHTDDTATDEHNNPLSYRRALELANRIQRHLAAAGKKRGSFYAIYPIGMGETQLLPQQPGESVEAWRTRCRRIELSFRSLRGSEQARK